MRVLISQRAEEDLSRIYAWLASNYDIEKAEGFRVRTEKALGQVERHPLLGPYPGWATRHKLLRFWVISRSNYVIYYEVKEEYISIERILDGRRDVRRIVELRLEEDPDETD